MPPTRYAFAGHPAFLDAARSALGLPVAASDEARRQPALTRLANLVAQAGDAHGAPRTGVLSEARKSRDALAVALRAAELILIDAHAGLGQTVPDFETPARKPQVAAPAPTPAAAPKASK